MIVKCKINSVDEDYLINKDLSESLIIDKEYEVYRIINREKCYYLIFDGSHLIEAPSQMFIIIDNTVPSDWVVTFSSNTLIIGLQKFNEEYWFDDFTELNEQERINEVEDLS